MGILWRWARSLFVFSGLRLGCDALVDGAGVSLQPNSRLGLSGLRCQAGRLCVSQRKIGAVLIIWVSFATRLVVADSGAKNFSHVDGPAVRLDGDTRALL